MWMPRPGKLIITFARSRKTGSLDGALRSGCGMNRRPLKLRFLCFLRWGRLSQAFCVLVVCCASLLLAEDIPRPEYPQPQFQREQWMNLNGQWEFAFDDGNRGLEEHWAGGARKFDRNITVPFCFESA